MRRSEIFDSFVKIAQEKGMISNDSSDAKKKLEETLRADSLSLSDIEALYGVKPDSPKSMEYEHNIMEVAHPNSIVVSPSYDKLNGLVENEIERQNINLHIVMKTPDGLLTQRKYAEKELILSLVRLANDLDNKDKEKLRILADTCLLQVTNKSLKKEGVAPMLVIGLIAGTIGAIYAHQHLPNVDKGLQNNYTRLISELDDFLKSNADYGVGYEYDNEILEDVRGVKDRLTKFYSLYEKIKPILRSLEMPRDLKAAEVIAVSQKSETEVVIKAYNALIENITNINNYIDKVESNFKQTSYKERHIKERGALTSLVDSVGLLHGGKSSLFADDFEDVVNAISPFKKSVGELLNVLQKAKSIENQAHEDLSASQAKFTSDYGVKPSENTPSLTKSPSKPIMVSKKEDNFGEEDLEKELAAYPGLV